MVRLEAGPGIVAEPAGEQVPPVSGHAGIKHDAGKIDAVGVFRDAILHHAPVGDGVESAVRDADEPNRQPVAGSRPARHADRVSDPPCVALLAEDRHAKARTEQRLAALAGLAEAVGDDDPSRRRIDHDVVDPSGAEVAAGGRGEGPVAA